MLEDRKIRRYWYICVLFSFQTDTDGLPTLKSIAQEATNRAGLKVPLSQASTQQIQQMSAPPGSTASSISQSGMSFLPQRFGYKLKMCKEDGIVRELLLVVFPNFIEKVIVPHLLSQPIF